MNASAGTNRYLVGKSGNIRTDERSVQPALRLLSVDAATNQPVRKDVPPDTRPANGDSEKQQEKPKSEDVIKTVVPEDARPKFKPVGKIDLSN